MLHIEESIKRRLSIDTLPTFNILHSSEAEAEQDELDEKDDDDKDLHDRNKFHIHPQKKEVLESFDFNDRESVTWRKVKQCK